MLFTLDWSQNIFSVGRALSKRLLLENNLHNIWSFLCSVRWKKINQTNTCINTNKFSFINLYNYTYFIIRSICIHSLKFLIFFILKSREGHYIIGHWIHLNLSYYAIMVEICNPIKKKSMILKSLKTLIAKHILQNHAI